MDINVRQLSNSLKEDFYQVHSDNGCGGWCFCSAWYIPTWEGFGDRTTEQNKAVREELFARGISDGYIVYVDEVPSGWVRVGLRDDTSKLINQFGLEPDPEMWAITCMALTPKLQGQGLAHEIFRLILDDLRVRGVKRIQAFPKSNMGLSKEEIWTGPISVFEKAGFVVIKPHERRPVLELKL